MVGYISYTKENKHLAMKRRRIGGLVLLETQLRKELRPVERLQAARAARMLAKRGVRSAVFPTDYPHEDIFARCGIFPVEILPLHRAMAISVMKRKMAALGCTPGTTTAAVAAERVTGEVERLLRDLALSVRYVILAGEGGEECCRHLQREYGVSVLRRTGNTLPEADVLLLLRPPEGRVENPIVLHLYDGERMLRRNGVAFALPGPLQEQVEENCTQEQLLSALLQAGMLQTYQIPIMEVDIPEKSYYNASTINNIE